MFKIVKPSCKCVFSIYPKYIFSVFSVNVKTLLFESVPAGF